MQRVRLTLVSLDPQRQSHLCRTSICESSRGATRPNATGHGRITAAHLLARSWQVTERFAANDFRRWASPTLSRVTEQMHLHKRHLLFDRHPVHDPTDISPPSALHLHHWTNDAFLDQPLRCGFLAEHTILFHHAVCGATWRGDHPGTKLCAFTMLGASTARRSKDHAKKKLHSGQPPHKQHERTTRIETTREPPTDSHVLRKITHVLLLQTFSWRDDRRYLFLLLHLRKYSTTAMKLPFA